MLSPAMPFPEYRSRLQVLLTDHAAFSRQASVDDAPVRGVQEQLDSGELSVAVVGEINRGKSTFLNALLGEKVFPSRVVVCTAGVTVLDHADEPRAEVVYRSGETESVSLDGERPDQTLKTIVSRKNDDVQDITTTRVWYPNPFTGNGIVLVDTPGVNDPEHWREEITYSYLAEADAVIMLLDPQQPLSASETEFLDAKILERSIANLIFVVNKIDDVPAKDRQVALNRIEEMLAEHVPNPTIYALAAKPALKAKRSGDEAKLKASGFPRFEEGLLDFLAKGRGGMLLKTKVQKALSHLDSIDDAVAERLGALDAEKGEVEDRLAQARTRLGEIGGKKEQLGKKLSDETKSVARALKDMVRRRRDYLDNSLKPSIAHESDTEALRSRVLRFQRDSIQHVRETVEDQFDRLLHDYGASSAELTDEVRGALSNLRREASNRSEQLRVERSSRQSLSERERRKAGAAIGAGLGGAAGAATAASGAAAAGASIGMAGIVGAGILTGGLGLLVGAGAAMLLGDGDEKQSGAYIDSSEVVNNKQALKAMDGFIDRLASSAGQLAEGVVESAREAVIDPVEQEMTSQQQLIGQIEDDLRQTAEEQADRRERLRGHQETSTTLRGRYEELLSGIDKFKT